MLLLMQSLKNYSNNRIMYLYCFILQRIRGFQEHETRHQLNGMMGTENKKSRTIEIIYYMVKTREKIAPNT